MKKIFLLFAFILCFTSCKKEPFFSNFDTIDYYSVEKSYYQKYQKRGNNEFDLNYTKILENDLPNSLNDTILLKELESYKFKKTNVSKNDINSFKEILNENTFTDAYTTACAPDYRNILILKKSNKIIGVLKICFGCEMYYLIGKNKENITFQKSGGISDERIKRIFEKYVSK